MAAYLDIETTGLSARYHTLTVVGIYIVKGHRREVIQLISPEIDKRRIRETLHGAGRVYTYNGSKLGMGNNIVPP